MNELLRHALDDAASEQMRVLFGVLVDGVVNGDAVHAAGRFRTGLALLLEAHRAARRVVDDLGEAP